MPEQVWETFNQLFKTAHAQGRRIEDLEARMVKLERKLRDRNPEAEVFGERPVLKLTEPEPFPLCPDCEKHHSAELPCAPADDWRRFGDEITGVPA